MYKTEFVKAQLERKYEKLAVKNVPTVRIKDVSKSGVILLSFSNTMIVP